MNRRKGYAEKEALAAHKRQRKKELVEAAIVLGIFGVAALWVFVGLYAWASML